jgi:ATP/maltotriose-dependent transcriptional regulator MalT
MEAHMLITGRSLPPAPLWRMRSKQTLCVVEESVMAFTEEEAKKLFASYGLREEQALSALMQTRGRASSLDRAAVLLSAPGKLIAAVKSRRKRVRRATILQIHGYLI